MAYKFQIGGATLSGSATYVGKIDSAAGTLASLVDVSGSGESINVRGTNAVVRAAADIKLQNADEFKLTFNNTHNKVVIDLESGQKPQMAIYASGSGTTKVINIGNTTGNDMALQILSGGVEGWALNKGANNGDVSGSGNVTITSTLVHDGNATIGGELEVNGTSTSFATTNLTIADVLLQVSSAAATDAASHGTGVLIGKNNEAYGSFIKYLSSSAQQQYIGFQKSTGTSGISVRANQFIGDGTGITGASADAAAYEVNELTLGGSPVVAMKNKTNIIKNSPTGEQRVQLPAMGGLSAGDLIRIKLAGTATETNRVKIETHPDDAKASIDEQPDLLLLSPSASVDFIYLGTIDSTGSYAVF